MGLEPFFTVMRVARNAEAFVSVAICGVLKDMRTHMSKTLPMRRAMLWHRIPVDGCNPKGHLVLFCVVWKDRTTWEGITHAKPPKISRSLENGQFHALPTSPRYPTRASPLRPGRPQRNYVNLLLSFYNELTHVDGTGDVVQQAWGGGLWGR